MEEIAKTIDLAERENGSRHLAVYTRKGFAIVEYIKNVICLEFLKSSNGSLSLKIVGIDLS